jgi:hypothetical protein
VLQTIGQILLAVVVAVLGFAVVVVVCVVILRLLMVVLPGRDEPAREDEVEVEPGPAPGEPADDAAPDERSATG